MLVILRVFCFYLGIVLGIWGFFGCILVWLGGCCFEIVGVWCYDILIFLMINFCIFFVDVVVVCLVYGIILFCKSYVRNRVLYINSFREV